MDKLSQLRKMTTVVADTGDISTIESVKPIDATTNPSLILKAASDPLYRPLIENAVAFAHEKTSILADQVTWAARKVAVNFGVALLKRIPGRISTEVDAHLSFDTEKTVREAEILMDLYAAEGVEPRRVLVKIASTWEGIKAAEQLEKCGIHCNLTLLFNLAQAVACAEAGATLISPFVGRIYDWHKAKKQKEWASLEDPGVQSVKTIFEYYKSHGYPTIIMGASFRNTSQIGALAGCDSLTISPALLAELEKEEGPLFQALDAKAHLGRIQIRPHPLTQSAFRQRLNDDAMATEKLAEGIRLFCQDLKRLEQMLQLRLT